MLLDPQSVRKQTASQAAALFVAGRRMAEGTEAEMRKLFEAEIANHGAPVELKVKTDDGYQPRLRRAATTRQPE